MRNLTLASAAALAVVGAANADFVDVQFTGAGAGLMVDIASPGHTGTVFAGQILLTLSNSTGVNLDGNWIAYCTDLYQTVTEANVQYEVLPIAALPMSGPMGAVKAGAIYDIYFAAAGNELGSDNEFCAAFQLAMWEIVMDYSGGPSTIADIGTGDFQAGPLTVGTAAYLNFLLAAIGLGDTSTLLHGLGNEGYQDQIISVPGPGALAAGAFGALVLGSRRRRK